MYKLTLNLLAFFCYFMLAAAGSNCVVSYRGPAGASGNCYWQWRNQQQCYEAYEYMKSQLSCSSGSGSGCGYSISGCAGYLKYVQRCYDIRGSKSDILKPPQDGQC
ncbi:hypothetical protein G6F16_010776 [Rhizopus arrhizus]|nr:hypothetical protein G6F24_009612 [Rhizopus arrhizus]KAG0783785.1 hypothetical protein G6F21_010324 [Rhizopus arrhizus]KAG0791004.1 hypothetical protein G6F22_006257 [Rhizopus arrhizus]KAG0823604.1 hypothetical protein G6F19_010776 [Rhizopus arrhizus]KAG0824738.1 hypothetical protein G6F18_010727 [Rhizopus arrhizus]